MLVVRYTKTKLKSYISCYGRFVPPVPRFICINADLATSRRVELVDVHALCKSNGK